MIKNVLLSNPKYKMYIDFDKSTSKGVNFIMGVESSHPTLHHKKNIRFIAESSFHIPKSNLVELLNKIKKQIDNNKFDFKIFDYEQDTDSEIHFKGDKEKVTVSGRFVVYFAEDENILTFEFTSQMSTITSLYNYFNEELKTIS